MAVSLDIQPALLVLDNVQQTLQKSPGLITQIAERRLRLVRPSILTDAKLNPQQPALPFIWSLVPAKQKKARAWYFANKVPKGSKGGRHRRTGSIDKATKVAGEFRKTTGSFFLANNAAGAEYVVGDRQVPSFVGHHPRFSDVALKWGPLLSSQLSEDFFTVADPTIKVR